MANYPAYPQLLDGGDEDGIDDLQVERAVAGNARGRAFFTTPKRAFTIRHMLTAAEKSALWSFYVTNRALSVTLTYSGDGAQYEVLFTRPPRFRPQGAGYWSADVSVVQV